MTHTEIRILLLRAGISQAEIARRLGVTVGMVNHIITERRSTKYIRKAIAESVGKRIEELWPSSNKRKAA